MKRIIILIIVAAGVAWVARWLLAQRTDADAAIAVERPLVRDLVETTVASGRIVPAREVSVKSRVSGVVEAVFVVPGQRVRRGEPLVNIGPVADEVRLSELRAAVDEASIAYRFAARELARMRGLTQAGVEATSHLDDAQREADQRALALRVARERLRLVRDGGTATSKRKGNIVRATVDGTVLDVPVEAGSYIVEANPMSDGTTLATIADLDVMIFVGHVDEADAGALRISMPLELRIAALSNRALAGRLDFIAPKSRAGDGPTTYEIKASIAKVSDVPLRAGYSANAEIVVARADDALSVREHLLQFDKGHTYLEVVGPDKKVERREVRTGLSDGIYVEVLSGVSRDAQIHVPNRD